MTVNFEHTEHFYPLHPHATAMGKYSVMADVTINLDEDSEEVIFIVLTSIRYKICSLLSEGLWETLEIPVLGFNREANKIISLFEELALKKYEELEKQRADQTA